MSQQQGTSSDSSTSAPKSGDAIPTNATGTFAHLQPYARSKFSPPFAIPFRQRHLTRLHEEHLRSRSPRSVSPSHALSSHPISKYYIIARGHWRQLRSLRSSHQLLSHLTHTARPTSSVLGSRSRSALRHGRFPLGTRGTGLESRQARLLVPTSRVRDLTCRVPVDVDDYICSPARTAWSLIYLTFHVRKSLRAPRHPIPLSLSVGATACAALYGTEYFMYQS